MDISKHIRSYLSEHPSVIVPELGRFTAVDKPSEIRDNIAIPPVRTVEYNSADDVDDGLLTAYIAQRENIDLEQARTETAAFYENLKKKLAAKKEIMLDRFGILSVNAVGDIVFEPDVDLFIERIDSFGLETVPLQEAKAPQSAGDPARASGQPAIEGSLFATENMRVRENTERRRPAIERQEPAVKPPATAAKPPLKRKPEPKKKTSGSGFPVWVLLVLLITAGLIVGGYIFYPRLSPYIDSTIASIKGNQKSAQPEGITPPAGETNRDAPHSEVAQTLDKATDKKNALNPVSDAENMPKPATQLQTKPDELPAAPATPVTPQPRQVPQPQSATTVTGVGAGRYLLIAGSFTTQARAEEFGRQLHNSGISYEIIDFGGGKVRVAVASFNDKTEAFNQTARFKSKPHCENIWVTRR